MYFKDDRVRAEIGAFARDITRRGIDRMPFDLKVEQGGVDAEELELELEKLLNRLGVFRRLTAIAVGFLNEGSRFYRKIIDLKSMANGNRPSIIGFELIKGPRSGFLLDGPIKSDDPMINGGYLHYELGTREPVNFFFAWEVTAFHWDYDEDSGYGLPLMSSGRTNYARISLNERDLSIARNKRAYTQLAILLDTGMDKYEKLVTMMEAGKKNLKQQYGVGSDLYFGAVKDVKQIDHSSAALTKIDDIEYAQAKMRYSLARPHGLSGAGGANVNRAVLDMQTYNWLNGNVKDGEEALSAGIEDLLNTQLVLSGYSPDEISLRLVWPPKHMPDPALIRECREIHKLGALSQHSLLQLLGTTFEREQELLAREREALALITEEESEEEGEKDEQDAEGAARQQMGKANGRANEDEDEDEDEIEVEAWPTANGFYRVVHEN